MQFLKFSLGFWLRWPKIFRSSSSRDSWVAWAEGRSTSSFRCTPAKFRMTGEHKGLSDCLIIHFTNTFLFCLSVRGRLGSFYVFSVAIGILLSYTCGTFVSYQLLPLVYTPISILFLIGAMFYPDSVHFFVKSNKNDVRRKVWMMFGWQSSTYWFA